MRLASLDHARAVLRRVGERAASAPPMHTGVTASLDALVPVTDQVRAMVAQHAAPGVAQSDQVGEAWRTLDTALRTGDDAEVLWPMDPALAEAVRALVTGARTQPGSPAVQAAWTWQAAGAPAVLCARPEIAPSLGPWLPEVRVAPPAAPFASVSPAPASPVATIRLGDLAAVDPGDVDPRFVNLVLEIGAEGHRRAGRVIVRVGERPAAAASSCPPAPDRHVVLLSGLPVLAEDDPGWGCVDALLGSATVPSPLLSHAEFNAFRSPEAAARCFERVRGRLDSAGMNAGEARACSGLADPPAAARRLADVLGVRRMNVHGDHSSLTVTRDNPERELDALAVASAAAALRAQAGVPQPLAAERLPDLVGDAAIERLDGDWYAVTYPTFRVASPAATVGLGDTFASAGLLAHAVATAS